MIVIGMPYAQTQRAALSVPATRDTLVMGKHALVGIIIVN